MQSISASNNYFFPRMIIGCALHFPEWIVVPFHSYSKIERYSGIYSSVGIHVMLSRRSVPRNNLPYICYNGMIVSFPKGSFTPKIYIRQCSVCERQPHVEFPILMPIFLVVVWSYLGPTYFVKSQSFASGRNEQKEIM